MNVVTAVAAGKQKNVVLLKWKKVNHHQEEKLKL